MDWTEKYRPETLDDVRGNDTALRKLRDWISSWTPEKNDAIILYGPPGIGKTTAAHAAANDADWDAIEMNASEHRTKDIVNKVAGSAAHNGTLTNGTTGRRLVILDEADNFHGNKDRGGAQAIREVVDDPSQPVVLIANEYYDMSKSLRNACEGAEFEYPEKGEIARLLRDIVESEGYDYEIAALKSIAANADGDVRGAVKDVQAAASHTSDNKITTEDVPSSSRDRTENIFPFLDTVLQNGSPEEALETAYSVDETPEDLLQWIEENVVKEYGSVELVDAYEHLAAADAWLGRVQATQNYSYWRYVTDHVAAGVANSRSGRHGGFTRWGPPSTWSRLGKTSGKRAKRTSIAQRIAETSNVSTRTAQNTVLPYLRLLTHHCKPRGLTVAVADAYEFDESDVSFVTGSGEDTKKVGEIVADASEETTTDEPTEVEENNTEDEDDSGANATLTGLTETNETEDTEDTETTDSDETTSEEDEDEDNANDDSDEDDGLEQATLF